ncbi:methyltransferase domain-containing protein [Phragmitibacter flavus]|uniref:Methyltransferase domain-containing protein n=1 Tax=Phragmitibacter flavus TaxID=2576071 RepID=A0A5R8K7T4_9BACT|nr:class I SAM-dependent methyltransferase [Phragmitibacter flavus]TLD68414.1 methyltransferase domain-containing protein [Phragmitibacter flavus]
MNYRGRFYPESKFGNFTDVDGTIAFYTRVHSLLQPNDVVIDVGCGRAEYQDDQVKLRRDLRIFQGKVKTVIGIDVDPAAQTNPFMDEVRMIEGSNWPLEDASANFVVADFVMEHLPNPSEFFSEAFRVLKPGGHLALRTTNRWNYFTLAARLIPTNLHMKVLGKVQEKRLEEDVFPKHYRCNTVPALRNAIKQRGFDGIAYGYEAEPSYLSFSVIAYWFGVLHQRFAPNWLRPAIFVFARKP